MGVSAAAMDAGTFVDREQDHAAFGGGEPGEGGEGAFGVRDMLGHHAESDEIERLLWREILENALMALVDDSIGLDVIARIDADKPGATLGKLACRLQVARERAAARADVKPSRVRGHDAENERLVKVGRK